MTLATPETLARIVNNPKYARYRADHEANAGHPLVRGCTIGRVFSFKGADYVYVGVKAGNTT